MKGRESELKQKKGQQVESRITRSSAGFVSSDSVLSVQTTSVDAVRQAQKTLDQREFDLRDRAKRHSLQVSTVKNVTRFAVNGVGGADETKQTPERGERNAAVGTPPACLKERGLYSRPEAQNPKAGASHFNKRLRRSQCPSDDSELVNNAAIHQPALPPSSEESFVSELLKNGGVAQACTEGLLRQEVCSITSEEKPDVSSQSTVILTNAISSRPRPPWIELFAGDEDGIHLFVDLNSEADDPNTEWAWERLLLLLPSDTAKEDHNCDIGAGGISSFRVSDISSDISSRSRDSAAAGR